MRPFTSPARCKTQLRRTRFLCFCLARPLKAFVGHVPIFCGHFHGTPPFAILHIFTGRRTLLLAMQPPTSLLTAFVHNERPLPTIPIASFQQWSEGHNSIIFAASHKQNSVF